MCLGSDLCEDITSGFLTLLSNEGEADHDTRAMEYPANIGVDHSVRLQVSVYHSKLMGSLQFTVMC